MKYLVVLADGMADEPIAELGHRTPLQYARTPYMDRLAASGVTGRLRTVPDGFEPGSEVANLSVLGYSSRLSTKDAARSKRPVWEYDCNRTNWPCGVTCSACRKNG